MKASAEDENLNWRMKVDDGFFVQPFTKFEVVIEDRCTILLF